MLEIIAAVAAVVAEPVRAPRSWISPFDYPSQLRGQGKGGEVEVQLTYGADGRLSGCTITKSSGNSLLDATTCRLLNRRSRARSDEPRVQTYRHNWVEPRS